MDDSTAAPLIIPVTDSAGEWEGLDQPDTADWVDPTITGVGGPISWNAALRGTTPVDWRELLASGRLEQAGWKRPPPGGEAQLPPLPVATAATTVTTTATRGRRAAPRRGGSAAGAPTPTQAAHPRPLAATSAGGEAAAAAAAAWEAGGAMTVQEKNRFNQRRHRERQRCRLADAEAAAAGLRADLDAARAEITRLSTRLFAAEAAAKVAAANAAAGGRAGQAAAAAAAAAATAAAAAAAARGNGGPPPPPQQQSTVAFQPAPGEEDAARRAIQTAAAAAAAVAAGGYVPAPPDDGPAPPAQQQHQQPPPADNVAAAPGDVQPNPLLETLFDASARLRAALRGIPYAEARALSGQMSLSELLTDRRMLSERVAALVGDPAHADLASPQGKELATLLGLRHALVRAFFGSSPKPMHMMFAAFERRAAAAVAAAPAGGGGPGEDGGGGDAPSGGRAASGAAAFAKWFHALRAMDLAPHQVEALLSARAAYLDSIRALRSERIAIKAACEGAEPSADTWGARSTAALTSMVAWEAMGVVLEKEEAAAAAMEEVAQRVLTPAQFAIAYVTGSPSMPDFLAISNLLFHDPARLRRAQEAQATAAAAAQAGVGKAKGGSGGGGWGAPAAVAVANADAVAASGSAAVSSALGARGRGRPADGRREGRAPKRRAGE